MIANRNAAYVLWGVGLSLIVGALLAHSIKILMGVFLSVGITACIIGSILYMRDTGTQPEKKDKGRREKTRDTKELLSNSTKSVPMLTKSLRLIKDYSVTQTYQEIKDLLTKGATICDVSTFSIENLVITTTDGTVLTADDCFSYEYTGDDTANSQTSPAQLAFLTATAAMAPCALTKDTSTKISITYNFTTPQDIQSVSFVNASSKDDAPVILGVTVQFINADRAILKEVPISSYTDPLLFMYP